mgnify:CR=1 FL=1
MWPSVRMARRVAASRMSTLAGSLGTLSEVRSAVPEVAQYLPYVLVIVGALIVFNRWNEHRQGIH